MKMQLRQVLQCSYCKQEIEPSGTVPRLPDGKVATEMCLELGICPLCLTPSDELSKKQLRRIRKKLEK
jgi:hypothetical protein